MGVVWFDLDEADHRRRRAIDYLDEPADEPEDDAAS